MVKEAIFGLFFVNLFISSEDPISRHIGLFLPKTSTYLNGMGVKSKCSLDGWVEKNIADECKHEHVKSDYMCLIPMSFTSQVEEIRNGKK